MAIAFVTAEHLRRHQQGVAAEIAECRDGALSRFKNGFERARINWHALQRLAWNHDMLVNPVQCLARQWRRFPEERRIRRRRDFADEKGAKIRVILQARDHLAKREFAASALQNDPLSFRDSGVPRVPHGDYRAGAKARWTEVVLSSDGTNAGGLRAFARCSKA